MAEGQNVNPFSGDELPKPPGADEGTFMQRFNHQPVAARVPERIGRGVFSTGVLVQDGPAEFVLDFVQNLAKPPTIVARVVLSPLAMMSFVNSLRENFGNFTRSFGPPQPLPKPPTQHRPSIQELYEHFKLPDELLSGVYSNSFLIAHSPSEFVFDFITGFFPTAAVACRAYLSAQQIPRLLETLGSSLSQHQQRFGAPVTALPPAVTPQGLASAHPPAPAPPTPPAPPAPPIPPAAPGEPQA